MLTLDMTHPYEGNQHICKINNYPYLAAMVLTKGLTKAMQATLISWDLTGIRNVSLNIPTSAV